MLRSKFIISAIVSFVIFLSYQSNVSAKSLKRVERDIKTYTTKYDNVDVDAILASNRLLRNYVNCLLDKGPCTQEGKTLKLYLPDALTTGCSKCNEQQKKIAGKILSNLLLEHREDYDKLSAKYDPDETFRKMYFSDDDDYSDLEEA